MSWEDELFEYAKFRNPHMGKQMTLITTYEKPELLYCEVIWNTIEVYTSQWNKPRHRVCVKEIISSENSIFDSDQVRDNAMYLDLGARLFNELKKFAKTKPKYLKILKLSNPKDKFDVNYHASEYKLTKQEKITDTKAKK